MTLTLGQIRELMTAHGLRPSRALGQNFVADPNTVRRVARLAEVGPGDRVLEVGAGLGALTLALVETGAAVTALEADSRLIAPLRTVVPPAVTLVNDDAMRVDWDSLLGREPGWVMVSNLPYNIATPLIADMLDSVPSVSRMVVMVQREVGERLAAAPGDPAYGAVSVKVAYWASASLIGAVPRSVFIPRPRVDSVLVAIRRRGAPMVDPGVVAPDRLFAVVRAGFSKRRKMLRQSLSGVVAAEAFAEAGVSPAARAEELSVEDWGRLAAPSTDSDRVV